MRRDVHSAGAAPAIEVVSLSEWLSIVSLVVVPDHLRVLLLPLGEGLGDDWCGLGGGLRGFLLLGLLVEAFFLVGALDHFLLCSLLEGFLVAGDVQGFEGVGHY